MCVCVWMCGCLCRHALMYGVCVSAGGEGGLVFLGMHVCVIVSVCVCVCVCVESVERER